MDYLPDGRCVPIPNFVRENASSHPHEGKMEKVMHEFKEGTLHSGSAHGPKVTSRAQAIAIAMSEARKARRS